MSHKILPVSDKSWLRWVTKRFTRRAPEVKQVDEQFSKSKEQQRYDLETRVRAKLLETTDLSSVIAKQRGAPGTGDVRAYVASRLRELLDIDPVGTTLSQEARHNLTEEMLDDVVGLGPLEEYLRDAGVTEIMAIGCNRVFIERNGRLQLTNKKFQSEAQLRTVIERIISPLGRRVDESSPMVDARLADGSRVNIVIPPLALNGPLVTIRKFSKDILGVGQLMSNGSITKDMAVYLENAVRSRKNIIISGGTGSGKTTLLNVLSGFIGRDERIVTIEDAAELQLAQEHVCSLEARPANIASKGQVTIRDLVRNALRMRPDRIIVGEVRGGEALDMLQAMNTGHSGSLTTCHANSTNDSLSRLEIMVLMAGMDLPVRAIRSQIAAAIDTIVQVQRLEDGSRKVMEITELCGLRDDIFELRPIYRHWGGM
jgi:pilus assembly protein CpaF